MLNLMRLCFYACGCLLSVYIAILIVCIIVVTVKLTKDRLKDDNK